ncbi:MAG TPA: hypothetical protein VGR35_21970 [Tepidisphaeraceae bacterium]|nr:hypothetical protein [Tepidisphaeraceae bacterium]
MRKIVLAILIVMALVLLSDSHFFEVHRHAPAVRREAAQPIVTKYHYSEGGHALPEYDGFIDAPFPTTLPATQPS